MSRHSRNNTANSVFTYAEKRKLDNQYGVKKSRIGQDSQRNFDQCHLCLNVAVHPVSCLKGHIFCRDCIMSNMLNQKNEISIQLKAQEKEKVNAEMNEYLKKRRQEEKNAATFEKESLELGGLEKVKKHQKDFNIRSKYNEEDYEKLEDEKVIAGIKEKKGPAGDNPELKKQLLVSSFWMAESSGAGGDKPGTGTEIKDLEPKEKEAKKKMICPGDNKHDIKLKDMFNITLKGGKYACYATDKELKYQKTIGLRTCGHLMMKDFFENHIRSSAVCLCGCKFSPLDVIDVVPANSAFCEHNAVEAKVYEPSFAV